MGGPHPMIEDLYFELRYLKQTEILQHSCTSFCPEFSSLHICPTYFGVASFHNYMSQFLNRHLPVFLGKKNHVLGWVREEGSTWLCAQGLLLSGLRDRLVPGSNGVSLVQVRWLTVSTISLASLLEKNLADF